MPRKRTILKMPDGLMAPDRVYTVVDVGPVVRCETSGETGHFDIVLHVEADGDPQRTISVPLVFLPSATRGSQWKNGVLVGHGERVETRSFIGVLDGQHRLITGDALYDELFLREERQGVLDKAMEIDSQPERRALLGPEFLQTTFAPLQHDGVRYYFPSHVVFTRFFFGSHSMASKILGGRFEDLYRANDSGWCDGRFVLECRGLSKRNEEFAIARLVSSTLGLAAMWWVRGSIVECAAQGEALRIRAYFPVQDRCKFTVTGLPLGHNAFLVHRVIEDKGLNPRLQMVSMGTKRQRELFDAAILKKHSMAPAPSVPEGAQLQADSRSEGNSAQKAAEIEDEALSNTYANSPADRKIRWVDGPAGNPNVPQTPQPIVDSFSTTRLGSSPSGLARGTTGAKVSAATINFAERPNFHVDQTRSLEILRGLVNHGFRCLPLVSDEELAMIIAAQAEHYRWLFVDFQKRQLRRIHLSLVGSQYEADYLRDCVVVDFERGGGKKSAHFYVLHSPRGINAADAPAIVCLLGHLEGKLRTLSADTTAEEIVPSIENLQTHQILDEAVEFAHELWGKGRYGHQSKKTANAILQFWRAARRASERRMVSNTDTRANLDQSEAAG